VVPTQRDQGEVDYLEIIFFILFIFVPDFILVLFAISFPFFVSLSFLSHIPSLLLYLQSAYVPFVYPHYQQCDPIWANDSMNGSMLGKEAGREEE
jgi:hypothetical protein